MFNAKARFSEIIQNVEKGAVYLVTKRGRAVAMIQPVVTNKRRLTKGCAARPNYRMAKDFKETPGDFDAYSK